MSSTRARHAARPAPPQSGAASAVGRAAEVIVVTHDPELERALREASPTTPLMIATTPAALADLLMTGLAGALVLDVGALDAAALTVARHLAEQFPDVPLVAVGSREDEARLAGLISAGLVYRFLHRPLSAARARTFIDAALRRGDQIGAGARPAAARTPPPAPPRSPRRLALAATGAAAVAGLGLWLALRPAPASPPARQIPAAASAVVERMPPPATPTMPALPALPAATAGATTADGDADPATIGRESVVPAPAESAASVLARAAAASPAEAPESLRSPAALATDTAAEAAAAPAILPGTRPDPLPPGPDPVARGAAPPSPGPNAG